MNDTAAILARIEAKLDTLLAAQRDPAERFCEAVLASWGPSPFFAADLLEWTDRAPELRREVREAAQALCRTAYRPTSRQLATALKRLSTVPLMWHCVEGRNVRNTMEWTVREVRD